MNIVNITEENQNLFELLFSSNPQTDGGTLLRFGGVCSGYACAVIECVVFTGEMRIEWVCVTPSYQGMGMARYLIDSVTKLAMNAGLQNVYAVVRDDREQRLFDFLGFEETERVNSYSLVLGDTMANPVLRKMSQNIPAQVKAFQELSPSILKHFNEAIATPGKNFLHPIIRPEEINPECSMAYVSEAGEITACILITDKPTYGLDVAWLYGHHPTELAGVIGSANKACVKKYPPDCKLTMTVTAESVAKLLNNMFGPGTEDALRVVEKHTAIH